jgi:hypothetical protein
VGNPAEETYRYPNQIHRYGTTLKGFVNNVPPAAAAHGRSKPQAALSSVPALQALLCPAAPNPDRIDTPTLARCRRRFAGLRRRQGLSPGFQTLLRPSNSRFGFHWAIADLVGRVAPSRADWISLRNVNKTAMGARRSDAPFQVALAHPLLS